MNPIVLPAFNPSPMTGAGNNTYLLIGPDGAATLIDAGVGEPRHLAAIAHALAEHHASLEQVLVTHAHSDHALGAAPLAAAYPGARFRKRPWTDEDVRYNVTWLPIDDGDRVRAGGEWLDVMATPGHSPDHLAFWHEASRTAFTGDLVIDGSSVMIMVSKGGNLLQYLASLECIRALNPSRLLPAHGSDVIDPVRLLTTYLDHRRVREGQIVAAIAAGRQTVRDIAESIYHGLTPPLAAAARENVRAHLDKLQHEGRAFERDGRWRM